MVEYDRTNYLYVFVPSLCSLLACLLLITAVVLQPPLRDRVYHRLSVALATTQIIMYSSWMLGNKEDASVEMCKIQDYLFQFGQSVCTVTITVINSYVFFVLHTATLPNDKNFGLCYAFMLGVCVVFLIICVSFDIASMFCDDEDEYSTFSTENFNNGTVIQKIILKCTYLYFLVLLLAINIVLCVYSLYQMVYNVGENKFMLPLLQRLLIFTLVVIFCGVPKMVSMFFFQDNDMFSHISDTLIHMSGVFLSSSYFYYAFVKDKRRWQTRSLLRENLLNNISSTPEDAIADSSHMTRSRASSSLSMSNFNTQESRPHSLPNTLPYGNNASESLQKSNMYYY